jgi:sec-independent protein translocase protein TatA
MSSPFYIIVILALGVLFFGKNLPGVAKQIGSALMEFRRGVNEWKEQHHRSSSPGEHRDVVKKEEPEERFESLGTKFEPPSQGGQNT